ncbi:ATP-grasp domain-containing protein [Sphingobacterium corticibacter]|uniref:ATP-grasp domain-containing protein n=1 Tax=Sphingobacterium corticibacter TaxID=2171749 RepID=A0A2T8HJF2_9SPHI|nr:hypothetical protein [Sphingobacterium corticibacter]PVH25569.1 hypothetical protein DC487_06400 [Sphingobacterium corticibacter]
MKLSISKGVHLVEPGDFEPADHWYPRALNSNLHPLVSYFLNLNNHQLVERYVRLNPHVQSEALEKVINYTPKYFKWAGTDLMHVVNSKGQKKLVVIETNSCPSGQKSMPLPEFDPESGGYYKLMNDTFKPIVDAHEETGALALIYDKNPMENVGYASAIADVFGEPVYLAEYKSSDTESVKFENGKLHIEDEQGNWVPIRAAFRYVTQHPWDRIPEKSKTLLLNPIEACLAGGRNKSAAYKAYADFNQEFKKDGLEIYVPKTFLDVSLGELASYYDQLEGSMVIKVPDSNAGQGVYTVTSQAEFDKAYQALSANPDDKYLIQELIFSNANEKFENAFYHIGTLPDTKNRSFAFDARMMVHATDKGMRPLAIYSRKSKYPLNQPLPEGLDSWEVYGTNLSVKNTDGWSYDDVRLILFDIKNFGILGLGLDELIEGFVQSCMAVYTIDQQAKRMFD